MILLLTSINYFIFVQDEPIHPTRISKAIYFDVSPPLRSMQIVPPTTENETKKEGKVVPNKIGAKEYFNRHNIPYTLSEDPVLQKQDKTFRAATAAPTMVQNFDGMPNILGYYPPDTQGDVSTDHYVQVVNINFAVYSKTGTLLLGPANLNTLRTGIAPPF